VLFQLFYDDTTSFSGSFFVAEWQISFNSRDMWLVYVGLVIDFDLVAPALSAANDFKGIKMPSTAA